MTEHEWHDANWFAMIVIAWLLFVGALLVGCGDAEDGCRQTEYELERAHYRCTAAGKLQTLTCDAWETLETCDVPEQCSPGPDVGCHR